MMIYHFFLQLKYKELIKDCVTGVAGRLVKSDKEANWLEADKITDVQVAKINLHFILIAI